MVQAKAVIAAPASLSSGTMGRMDLGSVQAKLRAFMAERDWSQFHSPENLAKSISIEAGELLECFQWEVPRSMEAVYDELADVLTYCLLMADALEQDPAQLVARKLEKSARKYPAEKVKGKSLKYDQYED